MLLASLQCHTKCLALALVNGDADDATGHGTFIVFFSSEVGGMRAAVSHGYAEALCSAGNDICSHFARRL